MKNILVFGHTGMLGNYIYKFLSNNYNVKGYSSKDYDITSLDWKRLKEIIKDFEIIINCSGVIPQKSKDSKKSIIVNTLFPQKLSQFSEELNINLIHITTDCVFDGKDGNYNELSNHNSENIYGITKSLGEPENCTTIRTSIIGEELFHKKSLLEWVKSNKGGEINGYDNHYWNGVTCLKLAEIIYQIIGENKFWKGVRHVFSPNKVSKYQLCKYINDIYELDITVNKINNKLNINKSLTSIYNNNFKINNIEEQIKEQSYFYN